MTVKDQTWSAEGYARNARFVADLADGIVGWLDPRPDERILDVGCGDGALTERLRERVAEVVGCDTSPDLLKAARDRGLNVLEADARNLPFDAEFDAVFSNAVLHWVRPPEAAVRAMFKALRPGGRLVAEFGGFGNVAAIITAMRAVARQYGGDEGLAHPWYFPTPEAHARLLERCGFSVERTALVPRPTPLPTGMRGWLATFRQPFYEQFDEVTRGAALEETERLLRATLCDDKKTWWADYVRIRVAARRPATA